MLTRLKPGENEKVKIQTDLKPKTKDLLLPIHNEFLRAFPNLDVLADGRAL